MENIKTKLADWKNRLKDRHMLTMVVCILILLAIVIALGIYTYNKQREYREVSENAYNMAFYELISYMEEVETYLAKATITSTSEHGAETLANVWSEANLAGVYLSRLPINNEGLSKAQKFLNQVSDYSYTLSMKAINGQDLTDEDLSNLEKMHEYATRTKCNIKSASNRNK